MRARCPEAKLIGKASLAKWRFGIMDRGYATISPTDSSIVWDGVWSITAADEKSLDSCEGVSEGLYWRDSVAGVMDGEQVEALVYIAPSDTSGAPRVGYLEDVLEGATSFGLPSAYIDEIGEAASWVQ